MPRFTGTRIFIIEVLALLAALWAMTASEPNWRSATSTLAATSGSSARPTDAGARTGASSPDTGASVAVQSTNKPPLRGSSDGIGTPGDQLMRRVAQFVSLRESIAARVRHEIHLFDTDLRGNGRYLQQGRGESLVTRFELLTQGHDGKNSLREINDGRYLWREQRLPGRQQVTRVVLSRVRRSWQLAARSGDRLLPTGVPQQALAIGGLPRLVTQLVENFRFGSLRQEEIKSRSGSVPVYEVVGTWRPEKLAAMLPEHAKAIRAGENVAIDDLPEQIPHEVLLLVDRETLFPYVFEYRRTATGDRSAAASKQPMVRMELFEVVLDAPIDPAKFDYKADRSVEWIDVTERYLPREEAATDKPTDQ